MTINILRVVAWSVSSYIIGYILGKYGWEGMSNILQNLHHRMGGILALISICMAIFIMDKR